MRPMTVAQIAKAVGGRLTGGTAVPASTRITAISTDTRTAGEGELFVAIAGENFDGHAFLPQAAAAGCAAAMVSSKTAPSGDAAAAFPSGLIVVEDTIVALGALAAHHRRAWRAKVVAVTGSNGKTTVKLMIHHILGRSLRGSASPKSFNNNIGVPLTLLGAGEDDDYVVCEIGTNAPGEIDSLSRIAGPDVAVITSIGPTHLEKLISVEQVAVEKASMLRHLAADGLAVVPADCLPLEPVLRDYDVRLVRFGEADGAEFRLTGCVASGWGIRMEVNGRLWVELPLPGRHNAFNALAAMAAAGYFGITASQAAEALADFAAPAMRLERLDCGELTVINDAYNANPASVLAAADVLGEQDGKRRVMVLGDMRELGPRAQAMHIQTGRDVAARRVDLLVCVGTLGRYTAVGAAEGGLEAVAFDDCPQAAGELPRLLRSGDVVLVKGSRAMGMEKLVESIRSALTPRPGSAAARGGKS